MSSLIMLRPILIVNLVFNALYFMFKSLLRSNTKRYYDKWALIRILLMCAADLTFIFYICHSVYTEHFAFFPHIVVNVSKYTKLDTFRGPLYM